MTAKTLGILGGSGLYDLPGLSEVEEHDLETPFGKPSDRIVTGVLHGVKVAFLPRHGRGHKLTPTELPYRANLCAMKMLGMDRVLGISAVGSMKEAIVPGHLVLIDQFIDRTRARAHESTFFGDGCVAHVHFADPVWEPLRQVALQAAQDSGATVHDGGTYLCMEGPAFSTRAESNLYRSWGVDVIGMTNLQEAKLAREAEIAYSTVALATDYDCWHDEEEAVNIASVIAVLKANVERAKQVVDHACRILADTAEEITCRGVMEHAFLTPRDQISADAKRRLKPILGHYLAD